MLQLTLDSFHRAAAFIQTHARPIDRRLFEYYFESGSAEGVIAAVANYQNPDGGFGHALEPDFRLAMSSPMATTVAFQYLVGVNAHPDHPVVRAGIEYLLNSYDSVHHVWPGVPAAVNDVPHAPWWHQHKAAEHFQANCSAECVAYLNAYPALVPGELLEKVNALAMAHLVNLPDEMEMHDLLCYLRLAQEIPTPQDILILSKLRRAVPKIVTREVEKWGGYCVKPLILAPTPYSPLADLLEDILPANLDYEIANQSAAGSWMPNWTWGQYPETWPEAWREWQGHLTVKMLHTLGAYGRIEVQGVRV